MTANWITGTLGRPLPVLVFALALAALLYMLWRTVRQQREDLERRRVAEETLRASMAEAEARARELAAQLEAAQRAAQRLSSSLDPDDVVEPSDRAGVPCRGERAAGAGGHPSGAGAGEPAADAGAGDGDG